MTGPRLTAMILFGALAFVFAFLFAVGLVGGLGALITGLVAAGATGALIHFVDPGGSGKRAFGRGFMALGAVFILVPVASLGGWAEQAGDVTLQALTDGTRLTEEEASQFVLTSIFASAGVIFGMIIGLILVLIGGLMQSGKRNVAPPPVPRG